MQNPNLNTDLLNLSSDFSSQIPTLNTTSPPCDSTIIPTDHIFSSLRTQLSLSDESPLSDVSSTSDAKPPLPSSSNNLGLLVSPAEVSLPASAHPLPLTVCTPVSYSEHVHLLDVQNHSFAPVTSSLQSNLAVGFAHFPRSETTSTLNSLTPSSGHDILVTSNSHLFSTSLGGLDSTVFSKRHWKREARRKFTSVLLNENVELVQVGVKRSSSVCVEEISEVTDELVKRGRFLSESHFGAISLINNSTAEAADEQSRRHQ